MKFFKFLFSLFVLAAGFFLVYVAMSDIKIEPRQVTKTIPAERFFDEN